MRAYPFMPMLAAVMALLLPGPAAAQLTLPPMTIPELPRGVPGINAPRFEPLISLGEPLDQLRLDRLADLVEHYPDRIELDRDGDPALRGIVIATGVDDAAIARAEEAGYRLIDRETIAGLDLTLARFRTPEGRSLDRARKALAKLLPAAEVDVDHLYFASGPGGAIAGTMLAAGSGSARAPLGLIDGGVAAHPSVAGRVTQKGFADGAPSASRHGTAVASLLIGTGSVRGAAPGRSLFAADVYGTDPVSGSASAIARALGWLAENGVAVTTISLVGPDNALLETAVERAQGRGMLIVAAVGNDGPAAPPAYPASYHGVLAVTGVDGRERVLPEAGRATHVDFAAPGDEVRAATGTGSIDELRGTSFAAPLVAGRLAHHYASPAIDRIEAAVRALIAEARDLGRKGRDKIYGHGLICATCTDR